MTTKLWNRLNIRLIVAISIILISILSIYTYIFINNLVDYLTKNSIQNTDNISDLIKKSTRYSMLLNRREDVCRIINHHYINIKVDGTSPDGTTFKKLPKIRNS